MEESLAEPLSGRQWVEVVVEEGDCPCQVEVEGSCLVDSALEGWVLRQSWQPREEEEEGELGLEVVEGGPRLMVVVELDSEN